MLCNWCDEPIVMETGDYKMVFRQRYRRLDASAAPARSSYGIKPTILADGWDEEYFHDYCFEDGTRGEDVTEDAQGELVIL